MPLKEALLAEVDVLSPAARRIGAINTVTARAAAGGAGGAVLVGDNTDWLPIRRLVEDRLAVRRLRAGGGQRALLVGARGTAQAAMYALGRVAGLEGPVLVYHRTAERARALAAELGGEAVTDLAAVGPVGVVRAGLRAMTCVHSRSRRELTDSGWPERFVRLGPIEPLSKP